MVFSKALNPGLSSIALEGSYASVIGGAPAAARVFAGEVRTLAKDMGGTAESHAEATAKLAARFDDIHSVGRAQEVGSIDAIITPQTLRPYIIEFLEDDAKQHPPPPPVSTPPQAL